jgi:pre-mRNA-splicing factor CWC26
MDREERLAELVRRRALASNGCKKSPNNKAITQTQKTAQPTVKWDDPLRIINNIPQPKYFPPNRFSIPPGPRWDGIDRSNGFEARWFMEQNAKEARRETAYRHDYYNL